MKSYNVSSIIMLFSVFLATIISQIVQITVRWMPDESVAYINVYLYSFSPLLVSLLISRFVNQIVYIKYISASFLSFLSTFGLITLFSFFNISDTPNNFGLAFANTFNYYIVYILETNSFSTTVYIVYFMQTFFLLFYIFLTKERKTTLAI